MIMSIDHTNTKPSVKKTEQWDKDSNIDHLSCQLGLNKYYLQKVVSPNILHFQG